MGQNGAFILAGIFLLLIGGGAMFYFLKRKEITKVVDNRSDIVKGITALDDLYSAGKNIAAGLGGKKSM